MTAAVATPLADTPILPWSQTVALMLSSLQIEALQTLAYSWASPDDVDILYLNTPWHSLGSASPCLVRVHRTIDPAFQQFLIHRNDSWGCVLVSDGGWDALVAHMRWLSSVKTPSGQLVLRNGTDAVLNHGLFQHAELNDDALLFGPCQQIVSANVVDDVWQTCTRPGPAPVANDQSPYLLSDEQWQLCEGLKEHRRLAQLYAHMKAHFPQGLDRAYVQRLIDTAAQQGLTNMQAIIRYASACVFLTGQSTENHPELAPLLNPETPQPLAETVERIALLAAQLPQRNLP